MTVTTAPERVTQEWPQRPLKPRLVRWGITAVIIVAFLWSALGLRFSLEQVLSAPADMWAIFTAMIPPDLSPEAIERALPKMMESVWIALIGTMIGAFFSFFLAFAAATNIAPSWLAWTTRQLLNAIRAVPTFFG